MGIASAIFGFIAGSVTALADWAPSTTYVDWGNKPTIVHDTNAWNNVRNQHDFTVPIHGPWLTNPKPDGMTITWITRVRCAAGVDYREKGTEEFTRVWCDIKGGLLDYTKDLHAMHLTGLKPDTEYEYRLLSNQDSYTTAYHSVLAEGREIYSFRTVNPKKDNYKAFLTCDFHGGSRLILDPMIDNSGAGDADFYFFAGDTVEDNMSIARFYTTHGFLDDITRKWGTQKPTIFMRGNHDMWGREFYQYADYFAQPDGKTYQAFRQGPVLWISLDTLAVPKEKLQKEHMEKYLQEQADWLKELKKSKDWKESKFRIVMSHFAPFATESYHTASFFNEVLNDTSSSGRIHLYFAGHMHKYYRINAGTQELRASDKYGDFDAKKYPPKFMKKEKIPEGVPYTLVVGNVCEVMTVDVAKDKLTFKSHRWKNKEGGYFDAFELYPDGKIKDLVEITTYSIK